MLVIIVIKTDASLLTEQANEWCRKPTGETRYTTPWSSELQLLQTDLPDFSVPVLICAQVRIAHLEH